MFKSLLSENIFLRTVAITGTVGLFIVSFLMDRSVFASSGNETNKAARIKIVSHGIPFVPSTRSVYFTSGSCAAV